ncbi:3-oxoacyl-[acyl-carrier protein] reductase [Mesorhizobium sp. J18]|uniref:SDR family NAD(P)-dependent oxidoreductase n=1 Tax=Mesorhizobium sp. J18 TaxID=935263 RepID=UPI001199D400|nr:glucose 1-dehydrogenase [Mesorhizobium sp. J18]TWG99511.1 3-oxoacyl-[acyl-carrier protein] reductase [Mesorhizobium sp. J18]
MDKRRFEGRAVLVAGGSRGIGAAVVRRLAGEGAAVGIGYRTASAAAESLVAEIEAAGGQAKAVAGDIGQPGAAEAMVEAAHSAFGRLDGLVNTAGIGPYRPLVEVDESYIRAMFDTNVTGAIMLTKAAAAVLPSPGGRIVHFASRLAYSPIPTSTVYAASKAAVVALTHGFAKELGPKGITVNAVAPGVIETDMTASIIVERGEAIKAMTPLGRIGQPDDIAGIVAFLLSDDAAWITGRTILADGGFN